MKILSAHLKNVGGFRGTNTIVFSGRASDCFDLVIGGNGSGKTVLLDALGWAIYGDKYRLSDSRFISIPSLVHGVGSCEVRLKVKHKKEILVISRRKYKGPDFEVEKVSVLRVADGVAREIDEGDRLLREVFDRFFIDLIFLDWRAVEHLKGHGGYRKAKELFNKPSTSSDSIDTRMPVSEGKLDSSLMAGVLDEANHILDEMQFGYKLFLDVEGESVAVMKTSGQRVSLGSSDNIVLCFAFYLGLLLNYSRGMGASNCGIQSPSGFLLFLDYELFGGVSESIVAKLIARAGEVFSQVIIAAKPCHFDGRLDDFLVSHSNTGSLNALVCMVEGSDGGKNSQAINNKLSIGNSAYKMYAVANDESRLGSTMIDPIF